MKKREEKDILDGHVIIVKTKSETTVAALV